MLQLAGEVADGVLLNYLPACHVPWSVEQVRRAGPARRARHGLRLRARRRLRRGRTASTCRAGDLFSYAVVDAYAATSPAGFGDEVAEIRASHAAGDRDGALAAVRDPMVDAIDVMGDADHVRATVQAYVDAGVDVPVLMPLPWGPDRAAFIAETLTAAIGA